MFQRLVRFCKRQFRGCLQLSILAFFALAIERSFHFSRLIRDIRDRREIRTAITEWKKKTGKGIRMDLNYGASRPGSSKFQDHPFFKVSSLTLIIFTLGAFCFGLVRDSQGSSGFNLMGNGAVVSRAKNAVYPKEPVYQSPIKTERVLGAESYQEKNRPNIFSNIYFQIIILSGLVFLFFWYRKKRKEKESKAIASSSHLSFLNKYRHKGVYSYLLGAIIVLLALKFLKSSFFRDVLEFFISFLPLIIIAVVSLVSYYHYLKEPDKKAEIRKKTLTEILYLLLITLVFYFLFSPRSFTPILTSLQKFLSAFFALENIFLLLSYFLVLFLSFSLIWFFVRLYQKSKGAYQGSISSLLKNELYASFFLFAFVFAMTFFAFPEAYRPITEVLGDSLYTASRGNIKLFKSNPLSYEKKSIGELVQGVKNAFSQTGTNLSESIQKTNIEFIENIKDTQENLNNSIAQTTKDVKESLSQDISKKLNLTGGTLDGSLIVKGGITTEDSSYFRDIYPETDDTYDLGLSSKEWNNLYVLRIHGSKGVTIGNSSSSHSLGASDDLLVSGDFETKGTAYFDGDIDLDSNRIINLADPTEEQDAATKIYVDNLVGAGAFFTRSGTTISVSNAGDTLDMNGGPIENIGNAAIAGTLTMSGGNIILGGNTFTTTNNTLIYNLNADLLDGQHGAWYMPISYLDTDDTLGANSDLKVASQKAAKTYIDTSVLAENLWDRSGSTLSTHYGGDKISISQIEAQDGNGLKLYDDGGNGIFVKDGGNVGIGTTGPLSRLVVDPTGLNKTGNANYASWFYGADDTNSKFALAATGAAGASTAGLFVRNDGNVGMGTTSPGRLLDIKGSNGSQLRIIAGDTAWDASIDFDTLGANEEWIMGVEGTDVAGSFSFANVDRGKTVLSMLYGGNVGIGTTSPDYALQVNGVVAPETTDQDLGTTALRWDIFANSINADSTVIFSGLSTGAGDYPVKINNSTGEVLKETSSLRYKHNIEDYTIVIDNLMDLRPVSFKWNSNTYTPNKQDFGLIAEEVYPFFPELVIKDKDGKIEGVRYDKLPILLLSAYQQQQASILNLGAKDTQISSGIETLTIQTSENVTTLEELKSLFDKNAKAMEKEIDGLNDDVSGISEGMADIEKQVEELAIKTDQDLGIAQVQGNTEDINLIKLVLGVDRVKDPADVDIMGKISASSAEIFGTLKAKDIVAENSVEGKTLTGRNLELGKSTRGKGEIKAGDKETTIETEEASKDVQIYITPLGKLDGKSLYVDMDEVKEGESFKVELDGSVLDSDLQFNWLIIK